MSELLTRVHLHYGRDKFNYYIRFGTPKYRDEYNAREAYEYYVPGAIFGYIRWKTNDYGTESWHFFVLLSGDKSGNICSVPGIAPGAEVLVQVYGKTRVQRLFKIIDDIEHADIDPSDVAPCYWVQTNARIHSSLASLPYTPEQHHAWLLERAVS